jgi:hypothetical protein
MSEYKMSEYTNIIFGEQDDEVVASQPQQYQSQSFCAWILSLLFPRTV